MAVVRKAKRNLTAKAIRLLRRVERHILQDGRRIHMESWERTLPDVMQYGGGIR